MKKMNRLLLALAALALVLALGGCEILEEVSAQDRMDDFIADLNGDNFDLKKHTSPLAGDYDTADEAFWHNAFDSYYPLGTLTRVYENDSTASYTAIGTGPVTFTFGLIKAGNSFLIQTIMKSGSGTPVFN